MRPTRIRVFTMGLFNVFKNKYNNTNQKVITLEDCIEKMFATDGIEPNREDKVFITGVHGKYCTFQVALSVVKSKGLLIHLRFPIPVKENVACAVNYEVVRIGKETVEKSPMTQVCLSGRNEWYNIVVVTMKEFEELTDNTPDEIREMMLDAVKVVDNDRFTSLAAAIYGYKSYEEAKMNVQANSKGENNASVQLNDGYDELLNETPNLSKSRCLGRLVRFADIKMKVKGDDSLNERAAKALKKSFDSFIQEAYNIANEEERDLIRKLRYLSMAKDEDEINEDDFALGKEDALRSLFALGNPQSLLYDDGSADYANMSEEEKLYKVLGTSRYNESPYSQGSLGEGMTLVRQAIDGYCKPRYLMDDDAKCAYEFMSEREQLVAVTDDDIDWGSLEGLSEKVVDIVKCRAFVFPGDIYHYENGVAEVRWEINPDGRFYCDEDGFGMTNDKEINLYGVIDRKGKVVKKFTLEK